MLYCNFIILQVSSNVNIPYKGNKNFIIILFAVFEKIIIRRCFRMTKIAVDSNLKVIKDALEKNGINFTVIPNKNAGQIKPSDFDILIISDEN